MEKYIPDYLDISEWSVEPHFQTGGSRSKKVVKCPKTGDLYYFKTSLCKEGRDYKYEFWSEIIASKIGSYLLFDLLDYQVAVCGIEVGCLSKSMIQDNDSELIEGRQYLIGTDSQYNPNDKKTYGKYTFQFIEKALSKYNLEHIIENIIQTIVFDSIIGNSDRHHENWAIIVMKIKKELGVEIKNTFVCKFIMKLLLSMKFWIEKDIGKDKYSPIYDSGCCFGREILDSKVEMTMQNIDNYITNGTAEIRWEMNDNVNKKISHYELIERIKEYKKEYKKIVEREIERVVKIANSEQIKEIVNNIDLNIEEKDVNFHLPKDRKELICKIITSRIKKLEELE